MNHRIILPVIIFLSLFILVIISLIIIKVKRTKKIKKTIEELDYEKNKIIGIPILSELSKVRELVKTDDLKQILPKGTNLVPGRSVQISIGSKLDAIKSVFGEELNIVYFGDNINDFECLKHAYIGVVTNCHKSWLIDDITNVSNPEKFGPYKIATNTLNQYVLKLILGEPLNDTDIEQLYLNTSSAFEDALNRTKKFSSPKTTQPKSR